MSSDPSGQPLPSSPLAPSPLGREARCAGVARSGLTNDFGASCAAELPRLRRYALYLTRRGAAAEDLVQDTLLRALEKQQSWQIGTDLRAWLFTVMHNRWCSLARRLKRAPFTAVEALPEALAPERADIGVMVRDVERALAALPAHQRAVIWLDAIAGSGDQEIADTLNVPIGTVKSRLSRGHAALKDSVDGKAPKPVLKIYKSNQTFKKKVLLEPGIYLTSAGRYLARYGSRKRKCLGSFDHLEAAREARRAYEQEICQRRQRSGVKVMHRVETGVYLTASGSFVAQKGKRGYLGTFTSIEAARAARL